MRCPCGLLAGAAALGAGAGVLADDLPVPLNFRNVTSFTVIQNQPEDAGNNVKTVSAGDYDNDGDLDVAVGAAGGVFGLRLNKLYRNDDGVFTEVTNTPVVSFINDLTREVYWRDLDNDGWMDLLVCNDDLSGGGPFKAYMAIHADGNFIELDEQGAARGLGFEASCGADARDVDNDGDIDIYSGNYPGPSQDTLYQNNGGNFTIVTTTHLPIDSDYTIDIALSDLNGNGMLDVLVRNHSPDWIYYNNLLDQADQGAGDYQYGAGGNAGKQNIGSTVDGAHEPGDFNGDGRTDFYATNKVGSFGDRIMLNSGNNPAGMVMWTELVPPPYVTTGEGNKIEVGDINGDGRPDILVSMVNGRPAILRNTSVNGVTSFVDWTPAIAFPSGTTHRGHDGALFDSDDDGDIDIFFGARNNDFMFQNTPTSSLDENDIGSGEGGGSIGPVYNDNPAAVYGRSQAGESDSYTTPIQGGFVSVVLNGPDDYMLEVIDGVGSVVETVDRGGLGTEEAVQMAVAAAGTFTFRVTVMDCQDNGGDIDDDCEVATTDLVAMILDWGPVDPGHPGDLNFDGIIDVSDLVTLILNWGPIENDYLLEVLSRTG